MKITPALLRRWRLPKLDGSKGKEARGHVLVVGGSDEIPGAIVLAAVGALRAGAGTLEIATTAAIAGHVAVAVPESRTRGLPSRRGELASTRRLLGGVADCDTILIGPGVRAPEGLRALVGAKTTATFVVDAGALKLYTRNAPRVRAILTPHAGEMAELCGLTKSRILADPETIARDVARRFHAVVALKGAATHVASPDGRVWLNTAGNLGLGTSGSGDTLSGVIAGLCARGATPEQAAVWGVYLHARAGDLLAREIGPLGFLARELLDRIPVLLARLSR
jgi:ADP-dependent NAD(P)H-hydrate dehydratase